MTHREQIEAFADDLDKLCERYSIEFDLPYASAVGVLQMKAFLLCRQAEEADRDDQDS